MSDLLVKWINFEFTSNMTMKLMPWLHVKFFGNYFSVSFHT